VLRVPHIANFTDFEPIERHPRATLAYVTRPQALDPFDLVILPGSKSVRADLAWLRWVGWEPLLRRHVALGGRVAGICGGFQMLGREIRDPLGVEGAPGVTPGLGLLDVCTTFDARKTVRRVTGRWRPGGVAISGYEIHLGQTERLAAEPACELQDHDAPGDTWHDGATSPSGRVWGTYVHGLFDEGPFLDALVDALGVRAPLVFPARVDANAPLDALADHFRRNADVERILALLG
jgi:adenosylcobyric acid synthase